MVNLDRYQEEIVRAHGSAPRRDAIGERLRIMDPFVQSAPPKKGGPGRVPIITVGFSEGHDNSQEGRVSYNT